MLYAPEVAGRSCVDCQKFFYDKMGERIKLQNDVYMLRASGQRPDCSACPKKSPEEAPSIELSPRNVRAYTFSLRAMAAGLPEAWAMDATVRRNLSIVCQMHTEFERKNLASEIALNLSALKR